MVFDHSGRITAANSALGTLLGYPAGSLLGTLVNQVVPAWGAAPGDPSRVPEGRHELEVRRMDGTAITVRASLTPMGWGDRLSFLGRLDGPLPRARAGAEEASVSSLLREEFLTTLSHELRSPLQSILSWAQMLASSHRDPALVDRGLDAIERNVRWQVEIIDDVVELSQILSAEFRLELQPVRASTLIEEIADRAAGAARAREIRLTWSAASVEGEVRADPKWLRRIVETLLSNALRFTSEGGSIELELRRDGPMMRLAITDASPDGATQPQYVHDPLRHGEPGTARHFHDRGVALFKVEKLVERHGGEMLAESAGFGRGARFAVFLPIHDPS